MPSRERGSIKKTHAPICMGRKEGYYEILSSEKKPRTIAPTKQHFLGRDINSKKGKKTTAEQGGFGLKRKEGQVGEEGKITRMKKLFPL